MARQGSKHASVASFSYQYGGGLNMADPPTAVADSELSACVNFWYPNGSNFLEVRPGLEHVAAPPTGGGELVALHGYVKGGSESHVIGAFANGAVCRLSGTSWVQFHTLSAPGVVPPFTTFHDKLIIGDAQTNLRAWNNTGSPTTLADSPHSTALATLGGRVVSNSTADADALVFSVPQDETNWQLSSGASFVRIGYGDGMEVRGFVPFASDLAVFKAGAAGGRISRLVNAALDDSNWSAALVADGLPLSGSQALAFVGNNVLYGTSGGVYDLAGVQEYGAIKAGVAGRKINAGFSGKAPRHITHVPHLGISLVFLTGDYRVFVYHPHAGAWTAWDFGQKRLTSACVLGDELYLGAEDGKLYRLTSAESADELTSGVTTPIATMVRGKQLVLRGEGITRRARLFYELLSGATIELNAVASDGLTRTNLLTINGSSGGGLLYDADGLLYDANQPLYASNVWYRTGRARLREQSLTAEVRATAGRYRIRQADFELAQVNG